MDDADNVWASTWTGCVIQPETYPPILLKWKAGHLRAVTGDKRYVGDVEIRGDSFILYSLPSWMGTTIFLA